MQYFEKTSLFIFKKGLHAQFAVLLIYKKIINISAIWNSFTTYFYIDLLY